MLKDITASNNGAISVKGTSEVTVANGVPEDKVDFSIEGNGVLSATSAIFDNNGNASVTVTGKHPYSGIINVKLLALMVMVLYQQHLQLLIIMAMQVLQ